MKLFAGMTSLEQTQPIRFAAKVLLRKQAGRPIMGAGPRELSGRLTGRHVTEKPNRVRRGVASSETAREINRDIILHAIHRHQPVSRADLARLTGLQPSTVSVIIGLLIDEGWVLPGTLGRLPRGRRPTFVTLNDKHVTLAIDLRPGNASLAVIDINGKILSRESVILGAQSSSKAEVQQVILKIATAARSLRDRFTERRFAGVGVSVSGRVDQKTLQGALFAECAVDADRSSRGIAACS